MGAVVAVGVGGTRSLIFTLIIFFGAGSFELVLSSLFPHNFFWGGGIRQKLRSLYLCWNPIKLSFKCFQCSSLFRHRSLNKVCSCFFEKMMPKESCFSFSFSRCLLGGAEMRELFSLFLLRLSDYQKSMLANSKGAL